MGRKTETKGFKGGFNPPEIKSTETRGRKESTSQTGRKIYQTRDGINGPIKGMKTPKNIATTPEQSASTVEVVQDTREILSSNKKH